MDQSNWSFLSWVMPHHVPRSDWLSKSHDQIWVLDDGGALVVVVVVVGGGVVVVVVVVVVEASVGILPPLAKPLGTEIDQVNNMNTYTLETLHGRYIEYGMDFALETLITDNHAIVWLAHFKHYFIACGIHSTQYYFYISMSTNWKTSQELGIDIDQIAKDQYP